MGKGLRSMPAEGVNNHCSPRRALYCSAWQAPVAASAALEGVLVGAVAVPAAEAVEPGAVVGVAGAGLGQVGEACRQLFVVVLGSFRKPVDNIPTVCTAGQRAPMVACRPRLPASSAALIEHAQRPAMCRAACWHAGQGYALNSSASCAGDWMKRPSPSKPSSVARVPLQIFRALPVERSLGSLNALSRLIWWGVVPSWEAIRNSESPNLIV
jgi:hypothetical protein